MKVFRKVHAPKCSERYSHVNSKKPFSVCYRLKVPKMSIFLTEDQRVDRLQVAIERFGGKAQLGRALGYKDGSFIGQMLRREKPITEKTLSDMAEIQKLSDLFEWRPGMGFDMVPNADYFYPQPAGLHGFDPAPALRQFQDVPVVGTVQGGEKGYLLELEHAVGHGDGHITYPARDPQSYAVRVRGDSMRPRIKAGEFIVVEPNHECQPGDDVVVVTRDGQRMVKELLYIRDGEVTLGSINNGHANVTVSLIDIEKMHYVAAIIPRGAFYKAGQ